MNRKELTYSRAEKNCSRSKNIFVARVNLVLYYLILPFIKNIYITYFHIIKKNPINSKVFFTPTNITFDIDNNMKIFKSIM